jgi:hypothetical protein
MLGKFGFARGRTLYLNYIGDSLLEKETLIWRGMWSQLRGQTHVHYNYLSKCRKDICKLLFLKDVRHGILPSYSGYSCDNKEKAG